MEGKKAAYPKKWRQLQPMWIISYIFLNNKATMASQPNLPTPHQTNYMDMPVPLLQQVQSIITPPDTDAATSSSDFFRINTQSVDTERIELESVSHTSHALISLCEFLIYTLWLTYCTWHPLIVQPGF